VGMIGYSLEEIDKIRRIMAKKKNKNLMIEKMKRG
jgi:DNA polymerase III alpha subunit